MHVKMYIKEYTRIHLHAIGRPHGLYPKTGFQGGSRARLSRESAVLSALLPDEAGDRVHEVELGEDFELAAVHLDENGGAFVA